MEYFIEDDICDEMYIKNLSFLNIIFISKRVI